MSTHKNRALAWPLWVTLLTAQIVLSLFLYNPAGNQALQIVGWIIGASAGFLGVWPIITLRRKGESPSGKSYIHTTVLVNSGIYAIVRHPQYLSFMLFNLFLMLIVQHWLIVAIGIAAIAMAYTGIMPQADRANVKKFGAAYERYMQETPGVNLLAGIIRYLRRIG